MLSLAAWRPDAFAPGTASALARSGWLLLATAILPLAIAAYSGVFVYRHTARRRKTQAAFTVMLSLFLSLGVYLAAALIFPSRLYIPPAREYSQAR